MLIEEELWDIGWGTRFRVAELFVFRKDVGTTRDEGSVMEGDRGIPLTAVEQQVRVIDVRDINKKLASRVFT